MVLISVEDRHYSPRDTGGGRNRKLSVFHAYRHVDTPARDKGHLSLPPSPSSCALFPGFAFGDLHFFPRGVDAEEDEKEDGEAPERGASVAEEG